MKRGANPSPQPVLEGLRVAGEWFTPPDLFAEILERFGPFTLDVAADELNAKCAEYFTAEQDGLKQPWHGRVFCNPPYQNLIRWVKKAHDETRRPDGPEIAVLLLPAHTSTAWFHDYALPHAELYWVRGKRRFGAMRFQAIMPSVVVAFHRVAA